MKEKQQISYRPLGGYATLLGAIYICMSFIFLLILESLGDSASKIVWAVIVFFMFTSGLVIIIFSLCRWDAPVYIGSDAITQKRRNKPICIRYTEIQRIKLIYISGHPGYLLRLYGNDGVITMRLFKCFECFMDSCTNSEIVAEINKAINERGIVR